MGQSIEVFEPGHTNAIAATATALSRALPLDGPPEGNCVFYNDGPNLVFVAMGAASMLATLPAVSTNVGNAGNSTPVAIGTSIPLSRKKGDTHWSAICPAGLTSSVYCTVGKGI